MKQKAPKPLYSPKTAAKPLWPWFSFIFAVLVCSLVGSAAPNKVIAQSSPTPVTYLSSGVGVKIDVQVNGQNANYMKLPPGSNFTALLTITKLVDGSGQSHTQLNLGTDKLGSFTIKSFGVGVGGTDSNACSTTSYKYNTCSLSGGSSPVSGNTIVVNQQYPVTISLSSSVVSALAQSKTTCIWNKNAVPGAATPCFGVYPFFSLQACFDGSCGAMSQPFVVDNVAVAMYYSQSVTPPLDVPGYGSNSGTVNSTQPPGTLTTLLNGIVSFILGLFQELIFGVFSYLVAPLISAILSIHVYTDSFVAVIYTGWEVVRNLCNIFFIVALIIIALATLFRVESYKYKDLLVQLIIAALLVNFSLVIAQAVLGIADTVQAQFLGSNIEGIRNLAKTLMLNNNNNLIQGFSSLASDIAKNNPNGSAQNGSVFGGIVQSVFWLALSLGTLFVFAAIAAFLVIRIVAIWLLLLVSPVAYAVGVLPATAHYREEWWKNFLKYAFFTPIMAFFLNMTAIMAQNAQQAPILKQIADSNSISSLNGLASLVVNVSSNILLLVFLLAALKVADMAGIYGAQGITDLAKKGIFAPFAGAAWLGKRGAGFAGRKWNEFTANQVRGSGREVSRTRAALYAAMNPIAFGKAWAKESERKSHRAAEKAEMAGLEVIQQRFDSPTNMFKKHGSRKIEPHVLQLEKKEEDEASKNLQNLSRENVAQLAAEYSLLGDDEDGKARKRGIIKLAMSKGYIDDIVQESWKTEEGRKMADDMIALQGLKKGRDYKEVEEEVIDPNTGKKKKMMVKKMDYNHDTRRAMYKAMFGWDGHHFKDHAAARLITEEGESEGMATGHLEYMTDMYFNNATKQYEFYDLNDGADGTRVSDGEAKMAGAEIAKKDSRTQAKIAWHSLMSDSGTQVYKNVLAKVTKAFAENPGFMQERTANKLVTGTTDEAELDRTQVREKFAQNGNLEVDAVSAKRLETIRNTDQRAFVSIISRFMNDATPAAVEARIMGGFRINGVEQDLREAQKLVTDKEDAVANAKDEATARSAKRVADAAARKAARAAAGGGGAP